MDNLTLRPDQTALLIVDVQEKLLPAMPPFDGRRLVACAELLIETARAFRMPVLVTEQYPAGLGPTVGALKARLEALETRPVVVEKTAFSACGPADVPRALGVAGTRSVVVVGMEAHVCVFQTARELARRGFHVHLPFDAVASRDPACRAAALGLLARQGVAVTTTETVVFDLLGDAKSVHFRGLSKLVKDLPLA